MVLRWGVLGSGKIARDFACSMLAVDGCEIVSVVSAPTHYKRATYRHISFRDQQVLLTTRFAPPVLSQASRRESETLTKFAEDFSCRSYGSYEAMAGDAEVDIVYVATIHPTHHALAKMALNAGKVRQGSTVLFEPVVRRNDSVGRSQHVLVEKPFTMNHREAAELVDLAADKGLFLMEAMCARRTPLSAPGANSPLHTGQVDAISPCHY